MGYEGCTAEPRCVVRPMALSELPEFDWGGPAVGLKAAAVPMAGAMFVEREAWGVQAMPGRVWTYFHEGAHLEGACCENCADWRAGQWVRQLGPQLGVDCEACCLAIMATLENRDCNDAVAAFRCGYGGSYALDGQEGAAPTYNRRQVEGYANGQSVGLIPLAEVRPGIWVNADESLSDWELLFSSADDAGIHYQANSSYRTELEQEDEWNKRHLAPWDGDPNTPTNDYAKTHGSAAVPGHSEHQLGRAVDLSFPADTEAESDDNREAFAEIAEACGIFRDAPRERWHFGWGGRRRYPLRGDLAGNIVAELGQLADDVTGRAEGSESNPPGTGHGFAVAVFIIALALVLAGSNKGS